MHSSSPQFPLQFQSTPSVWRETNTVEHTRENIFISIHSLRVEGDTHNGEAVKQRQVNFNPLPPCGGRLRASASN